MSELKPLEPGQIVLVTGGSGFLGRAIVKQLIEKQIKVRVLCRKSYPDLVKMGCEIFKGEISNADLVRDAVDGCEMVIHTAAKAGVEEPYSEYVRINVTGTENVIKACQKRKVKRLVYTSSPSVVFSHGDIEGGTEKLPYPDKYDAYYPETKAKAERMVLEANSAELATVSLRPHLIWGPGDNHLGPRLVSKAKAGKLKLVGDGNNKIDTVYITNAADAHILAAERLFPGAKISGKAYFITNGDPRPLKEIVNGILDAAGLPPVTATIPPWAAKAVGAVCEFAWKTFKIAGEPPITRWVAGELSTAHWFKIDAARKDLGFEPKVSIEAGMQLLKEHYQKQSKKG